MTLVNYAFLAGGMAIGLGASFADTEFPKREDCAVYKVARQPVTAYVLKPPSQPAPVFEPPMVKPQVTQEAENVSQPEATNIAEPIEVPRRKHRHIRRHRRYW